MKPSILRNMTWEEVKEISDMIDSLIVPFDDDEKTGEEVFYTEVLRRLRGQNGIPPPIEGRFPTVLRTAEQATSWMLTDTRERENTLIRSFVAYKLHNEGYSCTEIGKIMKRDHSTITNLVHRVRDMLSLPNAYKWEVQQFKRFEELLK